MNNKRYSIIRVDGKCPYHTTDKAFCIHQQEKRFCLECKIRDRYGDTKEQLVAKVKTAIERAITKYQNGEITKNKNRALAEIIVEFLGVEDERKI